MKKKIPLNQMMYLPDYFIGNNSQSFRKEDLEILYWHFGNEVNETVKLQIERLLKYAIKIIKNKEERRKRYLLPLKYLFCYAENSGLQDILKMEAAQGDRFKFCVNSKNRYKIY